MNNDKRIMFDHDGMHVNYHPLEYHLKKKDKAKALHEFEKIIEKVKREHNKSEQGFSRIINLLNSPN